MKLVMKSGMPEFDAYHDLWQFHKDFGTPEPGVDEYWDSALKARNELRDKYKGTSMEDVVAGHSWALLELWHNIARGGKR